MKNFGRISGPFSSIPLISLFVTLCLSPASRGDVTLTGLLLNGTGADGQTGGSPIWNTLGGEVAFANIDVTQPNAGYTAGFLNSGNGAATSISLSLAPGTYNFYFFTMGFWNNDPGQYGLNLFFNGDNTNPGISAYSPRNTITATPVAAGLSTLSLSGDGNNPVTSPGSLTFDFSDLSVTLTGYGFGEPGVFGGSGLDRISNLSSVPDLSLDSVGFFSLEVTAIPEPSALALFWLSASVLALTQRGQRKGKAL